jgi:hypothetical protein
MRLGYVSSVAAIYRRTFARSWMSVQQSDTIVYRVSANTAFHKHVLTRYYCHVMHRKSNR